MSEDTPVCDPLLRRERLESLAALDVSDATRRELGALLEVIGQEFDLPIALVSLVFGGAQTFLASRGLEGWLADVNGTPVEWSFCANVVCDDAPFVVEDAEEHAKVAGNPLVSEEGIRCYAGVPLRSPEGEVLGSCCVIGTEARCFDPAEIDRLRDFGRRAEALLAAN